MLRKRWHLLVSAASLCALAACASSKSAEKPDEEAELSTEVMLMSVVTEKCGIPDLRAFFQFNSTDLRSDRSNLDKLAECLTKGPLQGHDVLLVGRTDPMGSERYNEKLGLERAMQVGQYLMKQGVEAERLKYQSRGMVDASPDPDKYELDRRVDINIIL